MHEKQFPILKRKINGHPLVYLDNASTTQKPEAVLRAMDNYYRQHNANPHRGIHTLSQEATTLYEKVRDKIQKFINAKHREEIIFTSGATEAINLVVWTWGHDNIKRRDEILLTEMEHHSNLVPWQMLAKKRGAKLRFIPIITPSPGVGRVAEGRERSSRIGQLNLSQLDKLISKRTKLLALTHVSNVLGTINPVEKIIKTAHKHGVKVLVDGAQAGGHIKIDVQKLDADFYVLSGHKMYGPTGVGVLYGKKELLETMPPYQSGGHMINRVELDPESSSGRRELRVAWADLPRKFEAGTANIAEVVGLGAAVDFLSSSPSPRAGEGSRERLSLLNKAITNHEVRITNYALKQMRKIKGLTIHGPLKNRIGVISFNLKDIPAHDLASILDERGIAIRTGHHCAMPLHEKFGIESSARASLAVYNTKQDIDKLTEGIKEAQRFLSSRT